MIESCVVFVLLLAAVGVAAAELAYAVRSGEPVVPLISNTDIFIAQEQLGLGNPK